MTPLTTVTPAAGPARAAASCFLRKVSTAAPARSRSWVDILRAGGGLRRRRDILAILLEERSLTDLHQEMLEDLMVRQKDIRREIEEHGDPEGKLLHELNDLNKALGEEAEVQDDLFDEWEEALARGEVPDLDAMPMG